MDFLERLTDNRYIISLALFLFFLSIAKLTDVIFTKILKRLTRKSKWQLDDKIIDLFHRPVFYSVIIFGTLQSLHYIASDSGKVIFYVSGVVNTSLAVIWGLSLTRAMNLILENVMSSKSDSTGLKDNIVPLIGNILKVILLVGVTGIILASWEIDISPLIASAGIAGAAVAFAAKDTIANFFGGLSIFVDKPYKIGDFILLESGERGEVVEIGIRSTRIKTRDDILITIPNSFMANTKIVNESAPIPNFRIRLPVGVAYESDLDHVENVLHEVVKVTENVISDPEPRIRYRGFGDSSIDLELLCWIDKPVNKGKTLHHLIKNIHKKFQNEGISIPFPQRDVSIRREN